MYRVLLSLLFLFAISNVITGDDYGDEDEFYSENDITQPLKMPKKKEDILVAGSQSNTLRGQIVSIQEDNPISKHEVQLLLTVFTPEYRQIAGFCKADGSFTIHDIPPGSHMLELFAMGQQFITYTVEVSARSGHITAFVQGSKRKVFQAPLKIPSAGAAMYYEKRKPFNLMGLLKSPYGIMIVIGLVFMVLMPMMKIDPEELKQLQEQMKQQKEGGQQQIRS